MIRAFYHEFERRMGRYVYGGAAISFGQAVNVSFDLLREHGLRLDPSLTLAVKALMQGEAITAALYPGSGLTVEGVQMVKDMLVQSVTADKVVEVAKKQLTMAAARGGTAHAIVPGGDDQVAGSIPEGTLRGLRRYVGPGQGGGPASRAGADRSSSRSSWWASSSVQPSRWAQSWRQGHRRRTRGIFFQDQLLRVSAGDGGRRAASSLRLVWRWLRGRNTDED